MDLIRKTLRYLFGRDIQSMPTWLYLTLEVVVLLGVGLLILFAKRVMT